ncbi:hypothetical protein J1605_000763 [Eschrichtius robustus]|uniref:Uncharacterized protein n=1 Tax=Eschrichtius robustus TaxID=9764 RepID=A0AB34GQJ0_ESCRO|nr:hypothetical protein J1605_000763 [Eschrichtius robustus]
MPVLPAGTSPGPPLDSGNPRAAARSLALKRLRSELLPGGASGRGAPSPGWTPIVSPSLPASTSSDECSENCFLVMRKGGDMWNCWGAFLVVQWLRICLPMQGTWVRALVWEDPTCHGATKPMQHNY